MLLQRPMAEAMSPPCLYKVSDTPSIKKVETEKCQICWKPTDGTHFGVYSCRACAAFFRRSIAMNKKYVCRRGGDKCNLKLASGGFCRKCRLARCIETGMRVDYVQPIPNEKSTSPPENTPRYLQPCTSTTPTLDDPAEELTLLPKIATNYRRLCLLRKSVELNHSQYNNIKFSTSKYDGLRLCTAEELSRIYKLHLPAIMHFLTDSFPEYAEMEEDYKFPLFQSFMAFMWRLDNAWRTLKTGVATKDFSKINVVSETTYLDMEEIDTFISQVPNCVSRKDQIIKSLGDCMGRPRQRFMRAMNDLELLDEEYAALIGLALWDQTNSDYPDNKMAKNYRNRIWEDLRIIYKRQNMTNYALRLGELMTLYTNILFATARMRENVVLLELLDTFEQESIIYSFYKNCSLVG